MVQDGLQPTSLKIVENDQAGRDFSVQSGGMRKGS